MNAKNLVLASLVGAVASLLAVNVPFLNLVNLLLCIGFWGSAVLAVWIYARMTGPVTLKDAVIVGLATGLATGILGFALSFIGLAGGAAIANSIWAVAPDASVDIPDGSGVVFNLCGALVDILFGGIGGLIGGALFRKKA
ncbi:MAG: hypothetical protein WBM17_11415 [Anaerolineales bacterium]